MRWTLGVLVAASMSWGASLQERVATPAGYGRKVYPQGSFSRFVQTLPVKADTRIMAWNGNVITGFNVLAVVDIPLLFKQDLEQCADFAMRLWAEYHKQANTLDRFYLFEYGGKRKAFKGSGKTYAAFLKGSFANSNSYSLKKGLEKVASEADLMPGDMLVQNEDGGIGHVSVILDIAGKATGEKVYLIGFSYMPAQEFHVEKAELGKGVGGWFTMAGFNAYLEETLPYGPPVLRRFGKP